MDIRKRIGWNLRQRRYERDLTQEDFATDSGFDRGYISGVERGARNPSATVLARIAEALDADVMQLADSEKVRMFAEHRQKLLATQKHAEIS